MRKDLAKCLTECYRSGAGSVEHVYKIKRGGKVRIHPDPGHDYEDERGGFHSSSRHRQINNKNFGDKLGALRGNLQKNIGRPWDKVHSEFCQNMDRRSVNGHHVWTHLRQEVAINTYFNRHGVLLENGRRGPEIVDGYYVHPVTGILCYKKPERRRYQRPKKIAKIPVPGKDGFWYEQMDGLWYECWTEIRCVYTDPLSSKEHRQEMTMHRSCNRKEIATIMKAIDGKRRV